MRFSEPTSLTGSNQVKRSERSTASGPITASSSTYPIARPDQTGGEHPNVALGASHATNATLGASHATNATLGASHAPNVALGRGIDSRVQREEQVLQHHDAHIRPGRHPRGSEVLSDQVERVRRQATGRGRVRPAGRRGGGAAGRWRTRQRTRSAAKAGSRLERRRSAAGAPRRDADPAPATVPVRGRADATAPEPVRQRPRRAGAAARPAARCGSTGAAARTRREQQSSRARVHQVFNITR